MGCVAGVGEPVFYTGVGGEPGTRTMVGMGSWATKRVD
jgi:hypothetical protein